MSTNNTKTMTAKDKTLYINTIAWYQDLLSKRDDEIRELRAQLKELGVKPKKDEYQDKLIEQAVKSIFN